MSPDCAGRAGGRVSTAFPSPFPIQVLPPSMQHAAPAGAGRRVSLGVTTTRSPVLHGHYPRRAAVQPAKC